SKKVENFLVPLIIAVWLMSVMAIGYVVAEGVSLGALALSSSRTFFSALGMHANDLGRLYAVAYALLLFTWGETKDARLKTILLVTMGVLTIALLFTFSRGAFVGWVMVNVLFLVWKFNAKTIGLAILAGGAGLMLMPGAVVSRMSLGLVGGGDVNEFSAGRVEEIWLPLLPELFKSPLWGNGLEATMWAKALWAEMMLPVTHPHNAYIQSILDMGLLGTGLLLAYYWHVYRTCRDLGSNANLSPTMRGFYQGAVVQQCILARLLADNGYRVSMISFDYGQPSPTLVDGVTVYKSFRENAGIPVFRFLHPRLTTMWRALREVDADVYYQRSSAMWTGVIAEFCRRYGKRAIYAGASDRDFDIGQEQIVLFRDRWLYRRGLARVDRIIAQNPYQLESCRRNHKRDA